MDSEQTPSNTSFTRKCEYSYKGKTCEKPAAENSFFCVEHMNEPSIDLEIYKSLHERFRHYIDTTWTRTNFFFLVQAGFFTVFTGIIAPATNKVSRYLIPIAFVIGFVGLAIASLWYKSSKTSYIFVERWRGQVIKIDKVIDKRQHHTEIEEQLGNSLNGIELTQWLSLIFIVGWLVLLGVLLWLTLTD